MHVLLLRRAAPLMLFLAFASPARGQTTTPPARPNCDAPEYHQFDFWIGRWNVQNPAGAAAGTNQIERLAGGCALQERWAGAGGGQGTSLNFYDPSEQKWHQIWVAPGGVLRLSGGRQGETMVLSGTVRGANGQSIQQRITWTPLPGGRVRQHWETSADGQQWQSSFDGTYIPAAP
jgi:hypothetical protein